MGGILRFPPTSPRNQIKVKVIDAKHESTPASCKGCIMESESLSKKLTARNGGRWGVLGGGGRHSVP